MRYYERRGLINPPERTSSGYRAFPTDTVERVRMIKGAQALGFTLKEIKGLLQLRDDSSASCDDFRDRARAKLEDLGRRVEMLRGCQRTLEEMLGRCPRDDKRPARDCPLVAELSRHGAQETPP